MYNPPNPKVVSPNAGWDVSLLTAGASTEGHAVADTKSPADEPEKEEAFHAFEHKITSLKTSKEEKAKKED